MGYSCGFNWKKIPGLLDRLHELTLNGLTEIETQEALNLEFSLNLVPSQVRMAKERYGFRLKYLSIDKDIKIYKALSIPSDNYMVCCDIHAPYFSELWMNRFLAIGDKFKIRKSIIVGDSLDFDFIKFHKMLDGEKRKTIDEEVGESSPIWNVFDYFEINYLINGNHERRAGFATDSKIQAQHLFGLFGAEVWQKKFRYSTYDKIFIGSKWLAIHPKSYSQISGSVAVRLTEKYHRNVINAHGHFVAMRYDRSGDYVAIDLGGLFEHSKIAYIQLQTTTHPSWNNAFGALIDDHFYHFHQGTDFRYWLGNKSK